MRSVRTLKKSKISKEELEAYLKHLELIGFIAYLNAYEEDDVDSSESDTEERTDREESIEEETMGCIIKILIIKNILFFYNNRKIILTITIFLNIFRLSN